MAKRRGRGGKRAKGKKKKKTQCPHWSNDVSEHNSPALREALKQVKPQALEFCKSHTLRKAEIASWHRGLFSSSVPLAYYAGGYRQEDKRRPCLASNSTVGKLPGSDFKDVLNDMDQLISWALSQLKTLDDRWDSMSNTERVEAISLSVGTAVARFVHIHPFINGNGRTSRLLWQALLYRYGLPPQASIIMRPSPPYGETMKKAMQGNYGAMVALVLHCIGTADPSPVTE